jgi:hypothetical protein
LFLPGLCDEVHSTVIVVSFADKMVVADSDVSKAGCNLVVSSVLGTHHGICCAICVSFFEFRSTFLSLEQIATWWYVLQWSCAVGPVRLGEYR